MQLINSLDVKIIFKHDVEMLVSVVESREGIISEQLATIAGMELQLRKTDPPSCSRMET